MWKTPHGLTNNGDGGGGEFHKQVTHWQTPATDSFRSRGGDRKDEPGLDQQARCWPTPRTCTGGPDSKATRTARGSGGPDLQEVARAWPTPCANPAAVTQWPTPRSNDHKSSVTGNIAKPNARPLCEAISSFRLAPMTSTLGGPFSESTRKLNPHFVESLMGLPLGWTASEPLAMASYRSWLRTHTERFEQLSPKELAQAAA